MKYRNSCDDDGQNMLHVVNIRHGSVDVEISHKENTNRSLSPIVIQRVAHMPLYTLGLYREFNRS